MLTAKGTNSPARANSTCSAMLTPALSCASLVLAPRWGVTTTEGSENSGETVVGSAEKTSNAAPATAPEATAAANAASSTIPPRAVFTIRKPGLAAASRSEPIRPMVSGVLGRWIVRKSAWRTTSSSAMSSTPICLARSGAT